MAAVDSNGRQSTTETLTCVGKDLKEHVLSVPGSVTSINLERKAKEMC